MCGPRMNPRCAAMFRSFKMMSVLGTSRGHRSWHVKHVEHSHSKSEFKSSSSSPIMASRMSSRVRIAVRRPLGQPPEHVPH